MKRLILSSIMFLHLLFPWQIDTQEPIDLEPIMGTPIALEWQTELIKEETIEEVIEEPIMEEVPANKWGIELTDEEIDMLAKVAFLEAHTQSKEGVLAVIEVVFNRMIHDGFPDTLEGVLSQSEPCVQFTTWKNVDIAKPTDKEYRMIEAALNGEKEKLSMEYVFFSKSEKNKIDPIWIEAHCFGKARE